MEQLVPVRVDVSAFGDCNDEELLNFLNEMRQLTTTVTINRYPPNQGGPNDIFFVLSAVGLGAGFYLKSFLETLGSEHAKAANSWLARVLKSGNGKLHPTGMYPLQVGGDGVWFHLRGPIELDDFAQKMRLAADLIEISTGSADTSEEHFFYWERESGSWQPMSEGEYGPVLPQDVG